MNCEEQTNSSFCSLAEFPDSSPSIDSIEDQPIRSFDDLSIVRMLNKAKFPVFLGYSPSNKQQFAMKVFPFSNSRPNPFFMNEAKFQVLDHPNIISIVHSEPEIEANFEGEKRKLSYTVMELAPFGDFFELLITHQVRINETMARTFFHQLIEGLEYLHRNGVSHLDIKLENLLLGEDYTLKIADFDQAHISGQGAVIAKGTARYRAPELIRGDCKVPEAADIYSAGIILFILFTGGMLPHLENQKYQGVDFFDLMCNNQRMFWEKHFEIQSRTEEDFGEDFIALFNAMVSLDPMKRPTIEQIKSSKWYNQSIYTQEEVASYMLEQLEDDDQ